MSSWLFVPATHPTRFVKACQSGAAVVIIDLEDAVLPQDKAAAREAVADFDFLAARAHDTQKLYLRINSDAHRPNGDWVQDMALVDELLHIDGLIVPKATTNTLTQTYTRAQMPMVAVIESAQSMHDLPTIAQTKGVHALSFGVLDLAADLGIRPDTPGARLIFDRLRTDLVLYSAVFGLDKPIETIFAHFADMDGLLQQAKRAWQMGFGGQLCIHPKQVAAVHASYCNDDAARIFAQKIMDTYHQTGAAVFAVDGAMVDAPLIDWAKQVLASSSA